LLSQWLAGRVDRHLAAFAAHMREGLLAALTAVGLEVTAELMELEVTELAGAKAAMTPNAPRRGMAASRAASRWAGAGAPPAGAHRRRRR
jgi:hypothetical protein